jgi:hypothetical protein
VLIFFLSLKYSLFGSRENKYLAIAKALYLAWTNLVFLIVRVRGMRKMDYLYKAILEKSTDRKGFLFQKLVGVG